MNVRAVYNKRKFKHTLTFFTYQATVYALSDFHILHLRKEV